MLITDNIKKDPDLMKVTAVIGAAFAFKPLRKTSSRKLEQTGSSVHARVGYMKIVSWTVLLTIVVKRGYAPTARDPFVDALFFVYFLVLLFFPIDVHAYSVFSMSRIHAPICKRF